MKKRERIPVKFFVENGSTKASIKKTDQVTSTKNILSILDDYRKNREIVKGKKIQRSNYVDFIYDINVSGIDEVEKYSIVIRIKNEEKEIHYETIKHLDSLCDMTGTLRNVNSVRIAAGIVAGLFILVNAGPHIVKDAVNLIGENTHHELTEDQQEKMRNIMYKGIYYPTEEEKKEAEEEYYERLRQSAESGNEEAAKEYENYIIDQLILEQLEQEKATKTR